jgi:hypothetical protein
MVLDTDTALILLAIISVVDVIGWIVYRKQRLPRWFWLIPFTMTIVVVLVTMPCLYSQCVLP